MGKGPRRRIVSHPLPPETRKRANKAGAPFGSGLASQAVMNSLQVHICVLDKAGVIIAVNKAWRDFARANGLSWRKVGPGTDYLAVCHSAIGPDAEMAAAFAAGIVAVRKGERGEFSMEYPCHSPAAQRWVYWTGDPAGRQRCNPPGGGA